MSDKQIVERLCALIPRVREVVICWTDVGVYVAAYDRDGEAVAEGSGTLREALTAALDAADAL